MAVRAGEKQLVEIQMQELPGAVNEGSIANGAGAGKAVTVQTRNPGSQLNLSSPKAADASKVTQPLAGRINTAAAASDNPKPGTFIELELTALPELPDSDNSNNSPQSGFNPRLPLAEQVAAAAVRVDVASPMNQDRHSPSSFERQLVPIEQMVIVSPPSARQDGRRQSHYHAQNLSLSAAAAAAENNGAVPVEISPSIARFESASPFAAASTSGEIGSRSSPNTRHSPSTVNGGQRNSPSIGGAPAAPIQFVDVDIAHPVAVHAAPGHHPINHGHAPLRRANTDGSRIVHLEEQQWIDKVWNSINAIEGCAFIPAWLGGHLLSFLEWGFDLCLQKPLGIVLGFLAFLGFGIKTLYSLTDRSHNGKNVTLGNAMVTWHYLRTCLIGIFCMLKMTLPGLLAYVFHRCLKYCIRGLYQCIGDKITGYVNVQAGQRPKPKKHKSQRTIDNPARKIPDDHNHTRFAKFVHMCTGQEEMANRIRKSYQPMD